MPNQHLLNMLELINDDTLTEPHKTIKICVSFSAWVRDTRDADTQLSVNEQANNLDINSLEKLNKLLHSPNASIQITNMFSNPSTADASLEKFDRMVKNYGKEPNPIAADSPALPRKPLPKPPGRLASSSASTSGIFKTHAESTANASAKKLPPPPIPRR